MKISINNQMILINAMENSCIPITHGLSKSASAHRLPAKPNKRIAQNRNLICMIRRLFFTTPSRNQLMKLIVCARSIYIEMYVCPVQVLEHDQKKCMYQTEAVKLVKNYDSKSQFYPRYKSYLARIILGYFLWSNQIFSQIYM